MRANLPGAPLLPIAHPPRHLCCNEATVKQLVICSGISSISGVAALIAGLFGCLDSSKLYSLASRNCTYLVSAGLTLTTCGALALGVTGLVLAIRDYRDQRL
jgi:hypothetical protein